MVEFDEEIHTAESQAARPEAELARTMAVRSVTEAVALLPAAFREVLVLRELEGLAYKEIAQVAGVPIGTVMSRLARGRRRLALVLGVEPREGG